MVYQDQSDKAAETPLELESRSFGYMANLALAALLSSFELSILYDVSA